MSDREQQIEEMAKVIADAESRKPYIVTCTDKAQFLYDYGYRKMDEVTLRIDLGDRTLEEIAKALADAESKVKMGFLYVNGYQREAKSRFFMAKKGAEAIWKRLQKEYGVEDDE